MRRMMLLLACVTIALMCVAFYGIENAALAGCCLASVCVEPLAEIRKKLTLPQAAAEAEVSLSTIWRWVLKGASGIRLSTFLVGRKRFTTRERLEQFLRDINAAAAGEIAGEPSNAAEQRRRQKEIERADADLAADGLGEGQI